MKRGLASEPIDRRFSNPPRRARNTSEVPETSGTKSGAGAVALSALLFPNAKGPAWLRDAIEEMGAPESFLP
jgi:hypothetical protein